MASAARTAAQNLARAARQEVNEHCVHIQLRNLPRTAIPADLRRLVARANLQGVSDVALDYYQFDPTGNAYLTLTHPDYMRSNLNALQKASIATIPISAFPSPPPEATPPSRARGAKGRAEAANRGVTTGNGTHGGILNTSKYVIMWGLPGKLTAEGLKAFLDSFRFAGLDGSQQEICKIEKGENTFTLFSRHLVRVSSLSEAYHLVRLMHMTYFEEDKWGKKYRIRARVVY